MEAVILVYKTDAHHSYRSRDIIGIATTASMAIALCHAQARKEGEKIVPEQIHNLRNIKQTQGYSGAGEFQYESVNVNVLL